MRCGRVHAMIDTSRGLHRVPAIGLMLKAMCAWSAKISMLKHGVANILRVPVKLNDSACCSAGCIRKIWLCQTNTFSSKFKLFFFLNSLSASYCFRTDAILSNTRSNQHWPPKNNPLFEALFFAHYFFPYISKILSR